MKRLNDVFRRVIELDNIYIAHKKASRKKAHYKGVKYTNVNLAQKLSKIQNLLVNKAYKVNPYDVELINDKGKVRELYKLPYYPDRIIQWAIMLQLETFFNKHLCFHTCASLKGRGIKRAYDLSKNYLKLSDSLTKYCLKFDIKQFYPSINKDILKSLLRRKVKDNDLLWLLDLIIDSYPKPKGLPIGSYLSQYLANYYLSDFDHWLKEVLRIKYVVRYMDDICIYSNNKPQLHNILSQIKDYLHNKLDLSLKENYQIFPSNVRGVDFVGYRFFKDFILIRKRTAKNIKVKSKKILKKGYVSRRDVSSVYSYLGIIKGANAFRFTQKYLAKPKFMCDVKLGKVKFYNDVEFIC